VKLQALEEELPNALHDAMLRTISIDLVGQTNELEVDIWVGDLDGDTEAIREAFRPARIRLSALASRIHAPTALRGGANAAAISRRLAPTANSP
jgi:hypothetical protein